MMLKSVFIYFFISFVRCDTKDVRNAKLLSFDASKDDLEVGLDFSLPFLKIPIKSSEPGSSFGHHDLALPKINVNLSSLMVGGLVFLVTTFISPLITKSFGSHHRSSRGSDNSELDFNPLLEINNQFLTKNKGCLQRIACLSSQSVQDVDSLKIMKHIMRNELLSLILDTAALEEATKRGLQGKDCLNYVPCTMTKEDFIKIVDHLFSVTKSSKNANKVQQS